MRFRGNIACYSHYENAVRFFEIEQGRELDPLRISKECEIISSSVAYVPSERRYICAYIMSREGERKPNGLVDKSWTLNILDVMDRNYAWSVPFDEEWAVEDHRGYLRDHPSCLELSRDGTRVALAYHGHVHILRIDFRTQSMERSTTYSANEIEYRSQYDQGLVLPPYKIVSMRFSPECNSLAVSYANCKRCWDSPFLIKVWGDDMQLQQRYGMRQNVNYRLVESYACENATRSSEITPSGYFSSFKHAIYSTKGSFILIDKNREEFVRAKIPNFADRGVRALRAL